MMKRGISAVQYMAAHGNAPGPTHRPYLTGAASGALAAIPSVLVRYLSGTVDSEASALGVGPWTSVAASTMVLILAGVVYAAIFRRAANDPRGGWMFGAGYGFLLWMLGPISIWQWTTGRPLAVGAAAMGLFGAQVLYGLALGTVFPFINRVLQSKLNES